MSSPPEQVLKPATAPTTEAADATALAENQTDEQTGNGAFGPAVTQVLRTAAQIVAERSGEPVDEAGLMTNPGALAALLTMLTRSATLRSTTRARTELPAPDPGSAGDHELAQQLCSHDSQRAQQAATTARQISDEHRRNRRRARRNKDTAPAADRVAARDRAKLDEVREQRDRARQQLANANDEIRTQREQIDELLADVSTLTGRLDAAERRLTAARTDAVSVTRLAGTLSSVLHSVTAPAAAPTDPRGTGPGEPAPLIPTQPGSPAIEVQALVDAAAAAGLPVPIAEQAARWLPRLLAELAVPTRVVQVVAERNLTVDVLGGGTSIGGSCVLVTAGSTRLLIDAGSRPGGTDSDTLAPPRIDVALHGRIDAIIVTHAHNDHAGWVPAVIAAQPDVPVLVTDATASLLSTMWFDSAKVLSRRSQENPAEDGGAAPLPPYMRDDVRRALDRLEVVGFGQQRRLGDLTIELFPAGHIVGAAGVVVHAGSQRAVISGDVSRTAQSSVGGIILPESARGADLLLLESTYAGSARHQPREHAVADLIRDISRTVSAGGRVLVPAFALGRAQEVALVLAEHLPEVEVLVDGLARDVCEIYERQPGPDGNLLTIFGSKIRPVPRGHTRAEMVRLRAGVIIATSGMLHAGPSVTWARHLLPDPRNMLMVVGYQDEESPGRRLLDLAATGGGTFDLPNASGVYDQVQVNAQVGQYQLGAHASADDLVTITADVAAQQVMLVHGELRAQRGFADRLRMRRQDTVLADQAWSSR